MAENTQPKGRVQVLPAFEDEANASKEYATYRANQLLQVDTAAPTQVNYYLPDSLHTHFAEADAQVAEALAVAIGADEGEPGTIGSLQGTAEQGDWLHVRRRAMSLRYASMPRRIVHAASRRQAYVRETSGYVDLRVTGQVAKKLKESMR